MFRAATLFLGIGCLALAGCWTEGDDKTAAEVEAAFKNEAEVHEKAAENASGKAEERLEDTADIFEQTGEEAAEAVDEADLSANAQ